MQPSDVPLALVADDETPLRQPLADGKITLGSDSTNTVQLADPGVSRRHAQLVVGHGQVTVSNLNWGSGTYVNERRLGGPAPLRPGDVLRVGARRFRLEGPRRHEVLILGGGFGGVYTALELQKRLRGRRDVGVTLISARTSSSSSPCCPSWCPAASRRCTS